ncbi:MAG TPA: hypothetical protein VKG23_14000 [Thermoanaerobaculia bacterium]|nr:hypothetical protein [Thermoanaerobaculia bacterium]
MQSPALAPERALVPRPILRGAGALVLTASVVCGVRAMVYDATNAFRNAGPSVFPDSVIRQVDEIRREVAPGESILLVSASQTDGSWYTRLFQRALYPRNDVVVRYLPLSARDVASVRRVWSIHHGLELDTAPKSLALQHPEDLGALPAMPDHAFLGSVTP